MNPPARQGEILGTTGGSGSWALVGSTAENQKGTTRGSGFPPGSVEVASGSVSEESVAAEAAGFQVSFSSGSGGCVPLLWRRRYERNFASLRIRGPSLS